MQPDHRREIAGEQGARDTDQDRDDEPARVLAGHDHLAENAGDKADQNPAQEAVVQKHRFTPLDYGPLARGRGEGRLHTGDMQPFLYHNDMLRLRKRPETAMSATVKTTP